MKLQVTVKYFGSVKDDSGTDNESISLEDGSTISQAIAQLKQMHTGLMKRKGQILFALNQTYSTDDTPMRDGDELALFPVVSGG